MLDSAYSCHRSWSCIWCLVLAISKSAILAVISSVSSDLQEKQDKRVIRTSFFFQFDIYNRRIRKIPKSKFELRCGTSAEKCNRFCDVHWCIVFYTRNREINKLVTGSLGKNELYHKRVVLNFRI